MYWNKQEVKALEENWGKLGKDELENMFPHRSWDSIRKKALRIAEGTTVAVDKDSLDAVPDRDMVDYLLSKGYLLNTQAEVTDWSLKEDLEPVEKDTYRVGVLSCSHAGSKFQQPTNLDKFYRRCYNEGVQTVFHAGDMVDGEKMYRGHTYTLFAHGADAQCELVVNQYPKYPGVKTKVLLGNHDEVFIKTAGVNVLKRISAEREDIEHIGDLGAWIELPGGLPAYLQHGDGGVAYARSYKIQRNIQALMGRDTVIPAIYMAGHWHCTCVLPSYMGVMGISLGCFEGQTEYMRRKSLHPDIGGFIIEYKTNCDGRFVFDSITAKWIPFDEIKNDY